MFLPLYDKNPLKVIPFQIVTVLLMLICGVVFVMQLLIPNGFGIVAVSAGTIPVALFDSELCQREACLYPHYLSLITNIFAHGGWMHFLGNMLFLWIFGDNIEDAMGHLRFLVFYLLCGIVASLTHVWFNPDSISPVIGASGAIAGVMGAYLLLHPRVKILVLVLFRIPLYLPAQYLLIVWILFQFILILRNREGNIAVWAHIGGFVMGMALVPFFKRKNIRLFDKGVSH